MSSRVLYAACNFCHPEAKEEKVISAEEWAAKTDEERKKYAAEKGWIVGKIDRLIKHIVVCEKASSEDRDQARRLQVSRKSLKLEKIEAASVCAAANAANGNADRSEPVPLGQEGHTDALMVGRIGGKVSANDDVLVWLQTAKTLARDAGARIKAMRHPPLGAAIPALDVKHKSGSADLMTNADTAAQEAIFRGLRAAFPNHLRIGEEDSSANQPLTNSPTWIVDPIDGTTNYVQGISDVAVCIALAIRSRVVLGVVFNPFREEMFHAIAGSGAFLNDSPIGPSTKTSLDSAVVACEWGYERTPSGIDTMLAGVKRLMLSQVRAVRQLGSGALDLSYVACGRVDGVYAGLANEGWKIWDYAAAGLIAEESGARLTDIAGEPFSLTSKSIICATPGISSDFIAAIKP